MLKLPTYQVNMKIEISGELDLKIPNMPAKDGLEELHRKASTIPCWKVFTGRGFYRVYMIRLR